MENMKKITITAKNNDNSSNKDDDDDDNNNNNNNNKAVKGSFIRTIKSQYFKKLYM